jgi:hypothetical protein
MNKKFFLAATIVIVLHCAAKSQTSNVEGSNRKHGFTLDIPKNNKGNTDFFYRLLGNRRKFLHLDSLEHGFDSIQIRIWFNYSLARTKHLFVFKFTNDSWSGMLFEMQLEYDSRADFEKLVSKKVKTIRPHSGWKNFSTKLLALDIKTLPNESNGGLDGVSYCVEVATRDMYRFYRYWSPETTSSVNLNSRKMHSVIELLEREFRVHRLQQ